MSEVWEQREDVRKELRLIRKSLERIDSLSESMLKMQRVIAESMKQQHGPEQERVSDGGSET